MTKPLSPATYKVWAEGIYFSPDHITELVTFFTELERALSSLGPTWELAAREARRNVEYVRRIQEQRRLWEARNIQTRA